MVMHDWSVPADQDVEDMTVVKRANPLSTITVEELAKKRRSPSMTVQHWRRFVCNQAVRTEDTAVDPPSGRRRQPGARSRRASLSTVGLDLGWRHDTTAIVPLWMPEPEHRQFGLPTILTPPRDGTSMKPKKVKRRVSRLNDRTRSSGW
jgi:hypothetical protein